MGTPDTRSAVFVGLTTLDLGYAVPQYPAEDSKTTATEQFAGAGGPAANAAVAFAALGGTATLVTALGTHPLTDVVRADLSAHGVRVADAAASATGQLPVSSIVVARRSGSRTVVSLDSAGLVPEWRTELGAPVASADIVLLDGHYPALARAVAAVAGVHGVPVVLDAGRYRPAHDDLLPFADTVICSAEFAPPGADPFDHVLAAGARRVAVSRGPAAIEYRTPEGRGEIAIERVEQPDTLGAGDVLHGAYCAFAGEGFVPALRRAADIATLSCRFFGTRGWIAHLDEHRRAGSADRFRSSGEPVPPAGAGEGARP